MARLCCDDCTRWYDEDDYDECPYCEIGGLSEQLAEANETIAQLKRNIQDWEDLFKLDRRTIERRTKYLNDARVVLARLRIAIEHAVSQLPEGTDAHAILSAALDAVGDGGQAATDG